MRLPRRPRIDTREVGDRWQPRLYARLVALVLLGAYAIAFVLENRKQVSVHFVVANSRVSLIWLILLSIAIGAVGTAVISQLNRRRRRRRH